MGDRPCKNLEERHLVQVATVARPLLRRAGMQASRRHPSGKRRPRAPYANLIAFIGARLQERPDDLKLRFSLATYLGRAGRYREAIEEAERLLELAPGLRGARRLLLGLKLHRLLWGETRS